MATAEQQFDACVQRYGRLVLTVCLSFTRNYFDAEDLAQETFLSAYRKWDEFDGASPKAFLCAIAANKCRDFLRSPARRVESLADEDCARLPDAAPAPWQALERGETERRVERLCAQLREPYRGVATAYFCRGKKLSELAAETGVALKTLQTRLYRAKSLLRALWKPESGAPRDGKQREITEK